jgi:uncharacterized protein YggE
MKYLRLLVLPLILAAMVLTSNAQTLQPQLKIKKIAVIGSSEMEVDPDEIYVNFVLREYTNNKKEKIGIDAIKKDFLAACEKSGVLKENIRVEGMAGNAYDNWFIRKRKKDPEFIASITYVIKFSSTKMLDDLIPRLSDEAVQNMFISKMSHSKMETFRKEVKIKATQAAKEKATYLAESIGEKISGALLIEEIEIGPVYPMMKQSNYAMMDMAAEGAYGGETSMPFEKIKIRYETRAEFELQ